MNPPAPGPPSRSRRLLIAAAALAGIAFICFPYVTSVDAIVHGRNDFAMLYASARLVSTPYLYDAEAGMRIREQAAGERSPARQYTRLPYWAAFLWPLGRMSYLPSYWTFQALSIGALAASILLWPGKRVPLLLACCWSLPVSAVVAVGQDVFLLLLWVTLALRLAGRRPLAAGLALALCASKFHLFLHVPVLLAARREGRMAAGMGLGGAALALVSFMVAGAGWPGRFLKTIASPIVSPGLTAMPNLHNLLAGLPGRTVWEAILALGCAGMVWVVARRTNWALGLAAALVAGLLTSVHSYAADCALLIPAALIIAGAGVPWLRAAALALLLPAWYLPLVVDLGPRRALPAALLCLLAALAWEARRMGPAAAAAPPSGHAASVASS